VVAWTGAQALNTDHHGASGGWSRAHSAAQHSRRQFLVGAGASVAVGMPVETKAHPSYVGDGRQATGVPAGALDAAVELGALGGTRPYVVVDGRELEAVAARDAVAMLLSADTIWLGEHHEAANDREMQAGIIAAIAVAKASRTNSKPCVGVGLEAVRAEFQPALDAYVAGELGEGLEGLRVAARWDEHWPFPIASYASVLEMSRELGFPLVALGTSSDDLRVVEREGLAALDENAWRRLSLPEGATTFASFSATRAFQSYSTQVLAPSVAAPASSAETFANHFCSRILWDESMAARAAQWVDERRDLDPTLVVLAGAEHVTFGCGAPARCARRLDKTSNDRFAARSVLLNPSPDDFVLNHRLTLGLQFANDEQDDDAPYKMAQVDSRDSTNLPLSDLVWFSPWTPDCV